MYNNVYLSFFRFIIECVYVIIYCKYLLLDVMKYLKIFKIKFIVNFRVLVLVLY